MHRWSLVAALLVLSLGHAAVMGGEPEVTRRLLAPEQGCTVLYATDGVSAFGGNNEDFMNPLTKVWFIPGENGEYGRVYFGFEDLQAQGGMNEKGLFIDALGIDQPCAVDTTGKQEYPANLVDKVMCECATVDCAIEQFERYYTSEYWFWQFLLGDPTGVSAIIEADAIIRQEGAYQVATNFLQSTTAEAQALQLDWRYREATESLEATETLAVGRMRDILDDVHVSGDVNTLYSNVYDLTELIVYLYHFHDFGEVVVIDLAAELAKGFHVVDLPLLFPSNAEAQAWAAPKLEQRASLIESIRDPSIKDDALSVYEGQYEMPTGWGDPSLTVEIIAGEQSLFLRFPECRQFELHPLSSTEFGYVGFARSEYAVMLNVRFGLDDNGRAEYLELVMGDQVFRSEWISL